MTKKVDEVDNNADGDDDDDDDDEYDDDCNDDVEEVEELEDENKCCHMQLRSSSLLEVLSWSSFGPS